MTLLGGNESFRLLVFVVESLEVADFNADIIAKFQFPETPPWTYPTTSLFPMPRRIKRILESLHSEVRDTSRDYDFIYTDGSASDHKDAAAAIDSYSSIRHLPDKSSILSAELHALYLALWTPGNAYPLFIQNFLSQIKVITIKKWEFLRVTSYLLLNVLLR